MAMAILDKGLVGFVRVHERMVSDPECPDEPEEPVVFFDVGLTGIRNLATEKTLVDESAVRWIVRDAPMLLISRVTRDPFFFAFVVRMEAGEVIGVREK